MASAPNCPQPINSIESATAAPIRAKRELRSSQPGTVVLFIITFCFDIF